MVALPSSGRCGFTLVEALVAMLLSTLIVILVTTTFLVQNEFYADVVKRSDLQANTRGAAALVSSELRGVAEGGVATADPDLIVYRSPLVVGGVCAVSGSEAYVFFPRDGEAIPAGEVDGYAVRAAASGQWTYTPATWGSILHSSGASAAQACALAGADTAGAVGEFHRLDGLAASPAIAQGDLVLLYRTMEIRVGASVLDSSTRALLWGPAGGTLTEFATGLSATSAFRYRLRGQSTFLDQVVGAANLAAIQSIRVDAVGIAPSGRAGRDSLTFDLSTSVSLRNVR